MTPRTLENLVCALHTGELDRAISGLYGADELLQQRDRLARLLTRAEASFGHMNSLIISAPGRTELGGNHTDHNHGRVMTAAVHLDCLAVAGPAQAETVTILSEGFDAPIRVDLDDLAPRPGQLGTPEAIVRGVAQGLQAAGFLVKGFNACVSSTIPIGSGLSSSAAFEILLGEIFNHLFNHGRVPLLELARIGRQAENIHFGKPCGFMDQIACAFEGVLHIDFQDPDKPVIETVDTDFAGCGLTLAVVDTRSSHAGLTPHYTAITDEMRAASQVMGRTSARGLSMDQVMTMAPTIRAKAGDRALLRLVHFIEEDRRAAEQARALRGRDIAEFLKLVCASGDSSWRLLQNVSTGDAFSQPLCVALTMTEIFLGGAGAWRVQGGGFAGTIQAYVPDPELGRYARFMESLFGEGCVIPLKIRRSGCRIVHSEM